MSNVLKIKLRYPDSQVPVKGNLYASCYDLYTHRVIYDPISRLFTFFFGISVEIPSGYKLVVVPRSSFTEMHAVMANSPGQIDEDFRGELRAKVWFDPGYGPKFPASLEFTDYNSGRHFQFYLEKVEPIIIEVVDKLSETDRGEGGFGSTGKN